MSQQRQAAAKSGGSRAGQSGATRSNRPADHTTRNMLVIVIAAVVALILLGFGAAILYDRTSGSSGSLTAEEAQATAEGGDGARALLVKKYLSEHYGDATWYQSVVDVTADGSLLKLKTNLDSNPFGASRAAKMCDSVSEYIYGEGRSDAKFTSIDILDIKGRELVTRPDRNTVCTDRTS